MKYHITLMNSLGVCCEHTLDLPVEQEITWEDFENLKPVKDITLMNPTMRIIDITPDGMPDVFTDEEQQSNTARYFRQGLTVEDAE